MRLTRRLDPVGVGRALNIVRKLLAERPLTFQEILRSGIPLHFSGANGPVHRIAATSQKHALTAEKAKSEQVDTRAKKRKATLPSLEAPTRQQKVMSKESSDKVVYEIVPEGHPFISARFLKCQILATLARNREIVTKVQHEAASSSKSATSSSSAQKRLQFKYQLIPPRSDKSLDTTVKRDKPPHGPQPIETISSNRALRQSILISDRSKKQRAQSDADKKVASKLRKKAEKKAKKKEESALRLKLSHLNTRNRKRRGRLLEQVEGVRAEWAEVDAEVARRAEAAGLGGTVGGEAKGPPTGGSTARAATKRAGRSGGMGNPQST